MMYVSTSQKLQAIIQVGVKDNLQRYENCCVMDCAKQSELTKEQCDDDDDDGRGKLYPDDQQEHALFMLWYTQFLRMTWY